jgi:hypothetical protein
MIFAILLIPSLLASWFCYWFSTVFPSLSNRTSRIICMACPIVIALLLAAIAYTMLGASGTEFAIPEHPRWVLGGSFCIVAVLIVIPTLLLAFAFAKPGKTSGGGGNRQV